MGSDNDAEIPVSRLLEDALSVDAPTVGDLVDRTSSGGFALVLLLLTMPMLIPTLPPGLPSAIGALLVSMGLQMVAGRQTPLLPPRVRRVAVPASARRLLAGRALVVLRRMEAFTRLRRPDTHGALARYAGGATVVAMGLVMVLPIPAMNTPPALAVLLVALGISGRDGRFLLYGITAGAFIVLGLVGAVGAMWWFGRGFFGA
jgi:hypothetical protein